MAKKRRYTAKEVAEAIERTDGYVSKAADYLGCHVTTVYDYMNRYDTVKDAVKQVREKRHDFVENAIMRAIKADNVTAMIFYAKTQMKDRGYVERQEVTGADGKPIPIQYVRENRVND